MLLNKYKKIEVYTFSEFRERNNEDIRLVEIVLEHIKENKFVYARLVLVVALMLHYDCFIFANGFESSLDRVGNQLLDMLMAFAKWGCLAMGVKDMVVTLLNGGNMKHAINNGLMYLLGYIFISIYPQLFSMFQGIKF